MAETFFLQAGEVATKTLRELQQFARENHEQRTWPMIQGGYFMITRSGRDPRDPPLLALALGENSRTRPVYNACRRRLTSLVKCDFLETSAHRLGPEQAGAIRCASYDLVLAFASSGPDPALDELLVVITALRLNRLSALHVERLMLHRGNRYFDLWRKHSAQQLLH